MFIPLSNKARISQAIMILRSVAEDTGIPRNIRRAANEAIKILQRSDLSPAVRAANAIDILNEISTDPNMPPFARIAIWRAVSLLEQVKD